MTGHSAAQAEPGHVAAPAGGGPGVLVLHAWLGLSDGIRRFCLETVITESDLTLVLRVRGGLYVGGGDHLTLRYPDGRTVRIEPHAGRFDYAVPKDRQDDLMTPGTITAYDARGNVRAERPVAAVAYWHSQR